MLAGAQEEETGAIHEYSVTIQAAGRDLDFTRVGPLVETWCKENCTAAFFATERGGRDHHLHLQGVIRTTKLRFKTATAVSKQLNATLGFVRGMAHHGAGSVRTCAVKNNKMHTFDGLVGYCMKDSNQEWFSAFEHNITEEMKANGERLYLQYGADPSTKSFTTLSAYTIFQRASAFQRLHPHVCDSFRSTLFAMHQSGSYAPDAKWVMSRPGAGMDMDRAEAAWRMMSDPASSTMHDVDMVYFACMRAQAQDDLARAQAWLADRQNMEDSSEGLSECADSAGS